MLNKQLLDEIIRASAILEKVTDAGKMASYAKRYSESLAVIDEQGNETGVLPRGLIHRLGLRHRTVFVFVEKTDGLVLLQTRGSGVMSSAFRLDVTVGGHVNAEDSDTLIAAVREVEEEIGIKADSSRLKKVAEFNRDSPITIDKPFEFNRERRIVYVYKLSSAEEASLAESFEKRSIKGEVLKVVYFKSAEVLAAIDEGRAADGLVSCFPHFLAYRLRESSMK